MLPVFGGEMEENLGHRINAIIARRQTLAGLAGRLGPPEPVDLPFDLIIVPLDEERLDAIATSAEPSFDGFIYLTPTMAAGIGRELGEGPALYIETDYHGGAGFQGAALFEHGALVWKRTEAAPGAIKPQPPRSWLARLLRPHVPPAKPSRSGKSPISEGLAKLGVVASRSGDEFDRVGLGDFRKPLLEPK